MQDTLSEKQVVILESEAQDGRRTGDYELPNRSKVNRISETEFVVVQTGVVLTRTG